VFENLTSNIFSTLEGLTSNVFSWFYSNREILFWITVFLIASIIFTWLLKKFTSAKTYWIGSMYKTEKANPWFDKFAHHEKTINFLTELGLILGFGLIAVDFLYGKKLNKMKRFGLWIASIFFLYFVFEFVFFVFSGPSFITEDYTNVLGLNLLSFVFALTGFAGFVIFSLAINSVDIITKTLSGIKACPGVAPVIPGVEIPNVPLVIPLHAWISLLLILIIHEGFHGITARKEKLKIKSSGLLLLGFLPIGAFVEPDEEEVKKAEPLKQLRVYAAGPVANLVSIIVFVLIYLLLLSFLVMPLMAPQAEAIKRNHISGIVVDEVSEEIVFCGEKFESPAYGIIKEGMLLKEVNGVKIQVREDLAKAYQGKKVTDEFTFLVEENGEEKEFNLKPNKQGMLGFSVEEIKEKEYSLSDGTYLFFYFWVFDPGNNHNFFNWLFLLSLLVAVVNFLPTEPFDGGRIARVIFPSYFGFWKEEKQKKEDLIMKALFYGVVFLFILNAIPLFF
jgi:membrane-associated protease RseP (regulator of RpoE activity)